MTITTQDGIIAGMQVPVSYTKVGIAMAAAGSMRGYNPRYANGNPGPATAPSAGVNGTAVTGPGNQIARANPGTGLAYAANMDMASNVPGYLWLIDRLWENSGLSTTLTTSQAITAAALPSRDRNGAALGDGIMAAVEWSATGGAGTPTVTLTYTDQGGNANKTATLIGVNAPPVGTFEIFTPTAASGGIRAPSAFLQSATRTSGTMHLVLFRKLLAISCPLANVAGVVDALTGGMPRVFDNSCLELIWFPSSTTAVNLLGGYNETQG
jgi:hypothetical protein